MSFRKWPLDENGPVTYITDAEQQYLQTSPDEAHPAGPISQRVGDELRDRIAMAALTGMLASNGADWDIGTDKLFTMQQCYEYADAGLRARSMTRG